MDRTSFEQSLIRLGYERSQLPEITKLVLLVQEGLSLGEATTGNVVITYGHIADKARDRVLRLLEQALVADRGLDQITSDIKQEYRLK